MRKLGMIVVLGVAGLAVACGGSSSSGSDSGAGTQGIDSNGGAAGAAGGLATGGTSGGGASGSCTMPTCLSTALTGCEPSGTCVQQSSTTSFNTNTCYSNGVKVITAVDLSTYAVTVTFKNATKTCLTMSGTGAATSTTLTMKNGSGTTIGTMTEDTSASASVTTVTCTGGQPVTLDSSCDFGTSSGASSSCTDGAC